MSMRGAVLTDQSSGLWPASIARWDRIVCPHGWGRAGFSRRAVNSARRRARAQRVGERGEAVDMDIKPALRRHVGLRVRTEFVGARNKRGAHAERPGGLQIVFVTGN